MKFAFHSEVMLVRIFRRCKTAFAVRDSVCRNLNPPFTLMRAYTKKSCFVGFGRFSHVLKVMRSRNFAQIAKTVVAFVTVYVVNMLNRPTPRNVRPSNSVRKYFTVVDSYRPIAHALLASGNFTPQIFSVLFPHKNACCRVIIQHLTKMRYRTWLFDCHENQITIGGA